MNSLLDTFINEARELLETANECFLLLEKHPEDRETFNALFRAVHTIKGSSGIFDLAPLTRVVHAAEDTLDAAKAGEVQLNADLMDTLLQSLDIVSYWLEQLESKGVLPLNATEQSVETAQQIRSFLGNKEELTAPTPVAASAPTAAGWWQQCPALIRLQLAEKAVELGLQRLTAVRYAPETGCYFSGQDPIHEVMQLPGLCWYRLVLQQAWPEDAVQFDPFHNHLAFEAFTTAEVEHINQYFYYVADAVSCTTLELTALLGIDGDYGDSRPFEPFIDNAMSMIEASDWAGLVRNAATLLAFNNPDLARCQALRWLCLLHRLNQISPLNARALLEVVRGGQWLAPVSDESPIANQAASDQLLQQVLEMQRQSLEQPLLDEEWQGRLSAVAEVLKRLVGREGVGYTSSEVDTALATAIEQRSTLALKRLLGNEEHVRAASERSSKTKVLRVDIERINKIMDLVGEVVVAKNALPYLAKRAQDEFANRVLSREIKAQYAVINRIAEDLQLAVMAVRMVPVSSVFQRFPRLVRDLARKLEKDIRLEMSGEETEADKTIIEDLAEPLVHIVRNAIDHGIELPEVRRQLGKPPQARVRLQATQLDDRVIIEISDDGKGIDPQLVLRKALQKGLIDQERAEQLTNSDLLQLIFAPGFSTADQVSDLSGRGVGMDVVKTVIQQAGGSVAVQSEVGKGTTIQLSLPLSMAITQVLTVECAGQSYGVSFDAIKETLRLDATAVVGIKRKKAIHLRGKVLPLLNLRELLCLPTGEKTSEIAVMVVQEGGQDIAIEVDDFHAAIDVILKPLAGFMAGFTSFSGSALLGDGRVLLVLNMGGLLACR